MNLGIVLRDGDILENQTVDVSAEQDIQQAVLVKSGRVTIRNVVVECGHLCDYGIQVLPGAELFIENCTVNGARTIGFLCTGKMDAILCSAYRCGIEYPSGIGFYALNSNLSLCKSMFNKSDGFQLLGHGRAIACTAKDNGSHGIVLSRGSGPYFVSKCDSSGNGHIIELGYGIVATLGSSLFSIEDNICTMNYSGGIAADLAVPDLSLFFSEHNSSISGNSIVGSKINGIWVNRCNGLKVSDNIISRASVSGIGVVADGCRLVSNRIFDCSKGISVWSPDGMSFNNNTVLRNEFVNVGVYTEGLGS